MYNCTHSTCQASLSLLGENVQNGILESAACLLLSYILYIFILSVAMSVLTLNYVSQ